MHPIEIRDLTKRYGDLVAVDRLDLRVGRGEILGFLGPNGAGKSTTIKMLVGLVRPTSGETFVNGRDAAREPVRAHESLGYLPEVVGLYNDMTGRQFLRYTGRFYDLSPQEVTRRTEELLPAVSLEDAASRKVRTYSKGMRQRLALAAALFHDPQVLILDEPLTGLDPVGVIQMREAIKHLGKEKTIFLSSHELHAVEALCDRVCIVKGGRVLADAPVSKLTRSDPPRYRLETATPAPDLPKRLAEVDGVEEAKAALGEGARALEVTLKVDADPGRVVEAAVAAGARVTEFRRLTESLEEAFIRIAGVGAK